MAQPGSRSGRQGRPELERQKLARQRAAGADPRRVAHRVPAHAAIRSRISQISWRTTVAHQSRENKSRLSCPVTTFLYDFKDRPLCFPPRQPPETMRRTRTLPRIELDHISPVPAGAKLSARRFGTCTEWQWVMPNRKRQKNTSADESPEPLTLAPGVRFWLTLIDTTYEGPEEDAPEPAIAWVEVHSIEKITNPLSEQQEGVLTAKILATSHVAGKPVLRLSHDPGLYQFLDIKIKAEYAQDALGRSEGTGPYYTDSPRPNASEIPPNRIPREL